MDRIIITWLTNSTHSHCIVYQEVSSACMTSSTVKGQRELYQITCVTIYVIYEDVVGLASQPIKREN